MASVLWRRASSSSLYRVRVRVTTNHAVGLMRIVSSTIPTTPTPTTTTRWLHSSQQAVSSSSLCGEHASINQRTFTSISSDHSHTHMQRSSRQSNGNGNGNGNDDIGKDLKDLKDEADIDRAHAHAHVGTHTHTDTTIAQIDTSIATAVPPSKSSPKSYFFGADDTLSLPPKSSSSSSSSIRSERRGFGDGGSQNGISMSIQWWNRQLKRAAQSDNWTNVYTTWTQMRAHNIIPNAISWQYIIHSLSDYVVKSPKNTLLGRRALDDEGIQLVRSQNKTWTRYLLPLINELRSRSYVVRAHQRGEIAKPISTTATALALDDSMPQSDNDDIYPTIFTYTCMARAYTKYATSSDTYALLEEANVVYPGQYLAHRIVLLALTQDPSPNNLVCCLAHPNIYCNSLSAIINTRSL
jgi:hypothetical protein